MATVKAAEAKRAALNCPAVILSEATSSRITLDAHEIFKSRKTDRLSATFKREISCVVPINLLKSKQNIFFAHLLLKKEGFLVEL